MTDHTRTPQEIEREIERDRAQLTGNIETLQNRFSVDGVMRSISDQFREHGGDIGQSISRTVKENPAAVALTGIGLAWMIFGGKSGTAKRPSNRYASGNYDYDRDQDHYERRGYAGTRASTSRPDPRFKGGDVGLPSWALADDHDDDDDGFTDRVSNAASSARDSAADAARSARDGVSGAASSVREGASRAGASASATATNARSAISDGATSAANSARDMARTAKDRAARLRERLAEGTETLSEEARNRVIAAREAAVDARHKASAALSHRAAQASDLYDQQPLVAGALAVAVGAAIGGALPRTQKEDELLGEQSDALIDKAETLFRAELEKVKDVAEAAKDEAQTIAREKRDDLNSGAPGNKTAVEAVVDEAKSAGKRVADAAEKKADEKGLGKVST